MTVDGLPGGYADAGPLTVNVVVHPPQVQDQRSRRRLSFPSDQAINFRGSAFDPQDGDLAASATWSVDGVPVGSDATLFPFRIAQQGAHIVTLSATNSGALSATDGIKVNIGPATGHPSVSITSPDDNSFVGVGEAKTFTASASAPGGATISSYRWTDVPTGHPEVTLGTGSSISATLSNFLSDDGYHRVTVTVTDSFGRTASDSITVSVFSIL